MKVVINTCYGGFGLSPLAISRLWSRMKAEGRNKSPIVATEVGHYFGHRQEKIDESFKKWNDYLLLEKQNCPEKTTFVDVWSPCGKFILTVDSSDNLTRAHPDLVAVVESMGSRADGSCAKLKVVEIPDDVDFEIGEYDGKEHVAEKHRTWY